jgi:hypothetical protein
METSRTGDLCVAGTETRVGDLTRGFAPALSDREAHHGSHTVACAPERLERFGQSDPERTNHARGCNCHAGWIIHAFSPVWLIHDLTGKIDLDFYCFLKRSILQVSAKRETEARKLVDCQLSLFNGDLKSDRRKQLPGCVFLE